MLKEIEIYGLADLRGIDYTHLLRTDMSNKLDDLFGLNYIRKFTSKYALKLKNGTLNRSDIDDPEIFLEIRKISAVFNEPILGLNGKIEIPVSREAKYNFLSARTFMVAQAESEHVVDYYSDLAKKVGFFFALPYEEVLNANNSLEEHHIQRAVKEGYARIGITTAITGDPMRTLELTDKFCPLEKRLRNLN